MNVLKELNIKLNKFKRFKKLRNVGKGMYLEILKIIIIYKNRI